jgi:hypothetical protein
MSRYVVHGKKEIDALCSVIGKLNPEKRWQVSIAEFKGTRSLEQNDRFHAMIASICRETGNDPKHLKEWVKDQFGPIVTIVVDGKSYEIPKPSHLYDPAEASDVMNRLEAWAASELGVIV